MKKAVLVIMICIYALSSFGVGIKQFYCCGKLKSTSISFLQDAKEKDRNGSEKKGCCKTEFKSLKVKDNHIVADDISSHVKYFTGLHLFIPSFEVMAIANLPMATTNASHAPPIHHGIPVYILTCNFRI